MSGNNERRLDVFCDCSERSNWLVGFTYQGNDSGLIWVCSERDVEIWNKDAHSFSISLVQIPEEEYKYVTFQEVKDNVIEVKCGRCARKATGNEIINIFNYVTKIWDERLIGMPVL